MIPGTDCIGLSVFALIFNAHGEVLLVNHRTTDKKPKGLSECWSMPGGTVEFHEDCLSALRREVKEELGIGISDEKLINYNEWIPNGRHWVAINYSAKTEDIPKILEPNKLSDARFFNLNKLPKNLSEFCKECLIAVRESAESVKIS